MTILAGSTGTNGGTIITIPAGETWQGSLSISLSTVVNGFASIAVAGGGTGVNPAAGTNLIGVTGRPPTLGIGLVGSSDNASSISDVYVQAGDADATLVLLYFGTGTQIHFGSAAGAY